MPGELGLQCALHQSAPVPVNPGFVRRVDRRHRILAILDSGDCGLEYDVAHIGGRRSADRVFGINPYLDMQAIIEEQQIQLVPGLLKTHELTAVCQLDRRSVRQDHFAGRSFTRCV